MAVLDKEIVDELLDIMGEDFGVLVATYCEDASQKLQEIASDIARRDAEALRQSAHSFKGSCSNIGAVELASKLKKMESFARNSLFDEAAELEPEVRAGLELVFAALKAI